MSGWFDEGNEATGSEEDPREPSGAARGRSGAAHGHSGDDQAPFDDAGEPGGGERYRVKGEELLKKVKELIHEGNVRKITIRNEADDVLLSFPLTAGVLGVALAAPLAAVGAVAALVANCSIEVERRE